MPGSSTSSSRSISTGAPRSSAWSRPRTGISRGRRRSPRSPQSLEDLVAFYPRHIEKEDKHFFFPILNYFSAEEQDGMLREFYEFDRRMIHEKYRKVLEAAGGGTVAGPSS